MESIRKRTNVLGIFLIVISAAVLFHSIILNTKHIGYDFEFYHFPLFAFIAEQFRIGEFPLLDRFVYSAQDYLSNPQSMLFYPIQFAYLWVRGFFRPAPTLFEYQLFYLAHYLWAAIGTYCLSRKLGGSQLVSFATSTINIRSQRTSGWRIGVTDACPGTQLSVSENPDLSWVIMINGKRTPWTRPGERFGLPVDLEPGANSVEIEYNAPLLFTSFVIQFIGFIGLVAFAIVAWSTARPKVQAILT